MQNGTRVGSRKGIDQLQVFAVRVSVGVELGVSIESGRLGDGVLEQPMRDDHRAPDQLLATRHPLPEDRPVVRQELEVERRHPDAGVAVADRSAGVREERCGEYGQRAVIRGAGAGGEGGFRSVGG